LQNIINNETEIAIRTYNLTRNFGNRKAVDSLNLEIRKGQIYGLLGTNGAGKTTTIKMLSCLLKPTSGTAVIMGNDVREKAFAIKEMIGVSPQETAIAGHLNTMENLILMGGVFGMRPKESKQRALNLMQLMELEDRRDQARKLSGGLQRRLSIAMALMPDPQILFLDEPTLGLDPHARRSVWDYIRKLKKEKTILLTTHYLEEADALADYIAIMDKAKIIDSGTSAELKQRSKGQKILKLTGKNIGPEVLNKLEKLGYSAKLDKSWLEIAGQKMEVYEIIDALRSEKVTISNIHMQEPSLDDVFLKLTGKEGGE